MIRPLLRFPFALEFSAVLCLTLVVGCQKTPDEPVRQLKLPTDQKLAAEANRSSTDLDDWPNLFGPNRQSQIADHRFPSKIRSLPKEKWRIEVGTGYSSPLLGEGMVFVSHRKEMQEYIECFSAEDGNSLWSYSFPAPYKCPFEYSSGPYSTPVLHDEKVIVVGQAGHAVCLEQQTGRVLWSRNLFEDYEMELGEWPVAAGGIVIEDVFVFNLGAVEKEAGIVGLDLQTGETKWACTTHEAGHATPNLMQINGQSYVIMVTSNGLTSIDPREGRECWFVPFRRKKAGTYNAVSPVVFGNKVCMVTGPGPGTLMVEVNEQNQHKVLWKNRRILDSQYTNLLCIDGFLFGFTPMKQGGPELRCIDLLAQKLRWKWKANLGRAMMLAYNETILILGEKGYLAGIELSTSGPNPLFRSKTAILKGPCYSAPAVYNGRLYLRNEEHLVCLELAVENPADLK